jgi:hypothetical protein
MNSPARFVRESYPPTSGRFLARSFVLEPLIEGRGYVAAGNALTLDGAMGYAHERGGDGRVTRGGEVVFYWGNVPKEQP